MVTGWGKLYHRGPRPDILQEVNVTTISNQECRASYSQDMITDHMICAVGDRQDACKGDSGGPLAVLGQDGSYTQVGVISWGKERVQLSISNANFLRTLSLKKLLLIREGINEPILLGLCDPRLPRCLHQGLLSPGLDRESDVRTCTR